MKSVNTLSSVPSASPLDAIPAVPDSGNAVPDTSKKTPKIWTVGTLTYTSGGLVVLFCWLLFGDFAWSMRDRSVGPMASWYLKNLGVSNLVFGLLVSTFPAAVTLVLGPIISVKSDRHRGKWGRRIPFLLVTTPMAACGMIGIAFTPYMARWVHGFFPEASELLVAVACFGVFWAAFELATTAGQAVFGGLINDVVPKEMLGRFYGLFRAVSLIDGIIFNYWIMGKVPDHFTLILAIIGVFYGMAFMWVCFKVKEGRYPPPAVDTNVQQPGKEWPGAGDRRSRSAWKPAFHQGVFAGFGRGVRLYFRECFTNPYYVSVFVMLMSGGLAFMPVNTFAIPYARSLEMSMDFYGKCTAATFLTSLCLAYFLGWLADVFHPIRTCMVALIGYFFVTLFGWFFATTPERFAVAYVLHGVLAGCYYTSAASLGQRLYPHSRFAQFASAAGILTSICTMGLGPLLGVVIDWTGMIYRYTFLAGGTLTLVALAAALYVYGKFMKLGGPKGYVAPE
ncbi:MFS transporter [Opitutaceae bacterium TAV5]|nr:MFS transporter [Opitutaceae bacterium TAV5]